MCVCVCVCVCDRFTSFIIPLEKGLDASFKVWMKIDPADFTEWMSFLPSNPVKEINRNLECRIAKYLKLLIII